MVATKVELAEERERSVKLRNQLNKLANGVAAEEAQPSLAEGGRRWSLSLSPGGERRSSGGRRLSDSPSSPDDLQAFAAAN